jgi:ribosomal protein S18 acetylase RimI-like enzyme
MLTFNHYYVGDNEKGHEEYTCEIIDSKFFDSVGFCKYYKPDTVGDLCYIEYIEIKEEYRRKGYATQLVKELQKKYKLEWDYRFTDDGRKWYNSLISKKIVKNSTYV